MSHGRDGLEKYYELAFEKLNPGHAVPPIEAVFYPYVGINHTIRVRNGKAFVRISEVCRGMSEEAHQSLAFILVSKLFRKRLPAAVKKAYLDASKSEAFRTQAADNRRTRGRKVVTSPVGEIYDLQEIFDRINARYFDSSIKQPVLTWSVRKTYRILGHHDSTHNTISVSRSLDSPKVPRYIVDYVVFHEMLHIYHPTKVINGRRYNHTPEFRRDEAKFKYFREAEDWIEQNVRRLKRAAKRK